MGWWGVVFKEDISHISDYLAIGLTTGYLGSLTTFSGWNQKMLDLSVHGHWVFTVLGFLLGKNNITIDVWIVWFIRRNSFDFNCIRQVSCLSLFKT